MLNRSAHYLVNRSTNSPEPMPLTETLLREPSRA